MEKNNLENSIEVLNVEKFHRSESTEEVQDIIERMPVNFGIRISILVGLIFVLLTFFGWIIRYPDIVKGELTVNTLTSPIKLVANSSGKLKLNVSISQSDVKSGDVIAYIKNTTSFDTLEAIKNVLLQYDPNSKNTDIVSELPAKVSLGELTPIYYNFYSAVNQMKSFINGKLYDKQIKSLKNLYLHQENEVINRKAQIQINEQYLVYSDKFLERDSILYERRVTSEAEFDKRRIELLNTQNGLLNARTSQIDASKQAQQTLSKISELEVQKKEKEKELEVSLLASYNELVENISSWEQKYLIRSPFDGKVQFLRFWTDDQFVQIQEPIFTIIPKIDKPYGQVSLPAVGAGKVDLGQEVIVKLNDFPYNEYGSIKGTVSNISLTTNTEKTQQGNIEAYLLTLSFPNGLTTNYGKLIPYRHEIKGTAEIITRDRRLVERLFDNLKYAVSK